MQAQRPGWQPTAQVAASIIGMVRMLDTEILEEIIQHGRRYDAVGLYFDPTGWVRDQESNNRDTRILAALLDFRRTLDDVAEELEV